MSKPIPERIISPKFTDTELLDWLDQNLDKRGKLADNILREVSVMPDYNCMNIRDAIKILMIEKFNRDIYA